MTWVNDHHVGCSVGEMADHGSCRQARSFTCTWCGHFKCSPPLRELDLVEGIEATLQLVAQERMAQLAKHGEAMRKLPDGTGPGSYWVHPLEVCDPNDPAQVFWVPTAEWTQIEFREDYEKQRQWGTLTRMHLVREEIAEAFEADPDSPEFVAEIIQVAALCVQWAEYKTGH